MRSDGFADRSGDRKGKRARVVCEKVACRGPGASVRGTVGHAFRGGASGEFPEKGGRRFVERAGDFREQHPDLAPVVQGVIVLPSIRCHVPRTSGVAERGVGRAAALFAAKGGAPHCLARAAEGMGVPLMRRRFAAVGPRPAAFRGGSAKARLYPRLVEPVGINDIRAVALVEVRIFAGRLFARAWRAVALVSKHDTARRNRLQRIPHRSVEPIVAGGGVRCVHSCVA